METTTSLEILPAASKARSLRVPLIVGLCVWSLLVLGGLMALEHYANAPGAVGQPPQTWPVESAIERADRPRLLLFAHPYCPCTRATLGELERLAARCGGGVDIHVIFIMPDGTDWSLRSSDLIQKAQEIPGVQVHNDVGRRESHLFQSL